MSRYTSYSDEESDVDIHVSTRHRGPSPARRQAPVHYVEARTAPPRPRYVDPRFEDRFLQPTAERTVVTTRRSRSRDRRSSSPGQPPAPPPAPAPVIINNRIYNLSDSESEEEKSRGSRRRSHSRTSSGYSREREHRERDLWALQHARQDYERELDTKRREYEREREAAQKEYELERTQKELEELKLVAKIDKEEKRRERTAREERDLREAKKELDAMREKKERDELERRIKQKIELDRLKEEEAALAEKKRREKEAKEAVERYKKEEAERTLREKEEAEEREREYRHRMQETLIKSGLDEKEINAILEGKKVKKEKEKSKERPVYEPVVYEDNPRPTYTRMARRHLSLETLRVYNIDYVVDADPEYVLIKRWIPETEQDVLWRHTRVIREQRAGKLVLAIEDKKKHHHHLEPEFEWVRKKERRRSKSPSILTYLAGGRPA
ncbi:hypothetical protein F5Y19DRAFT_464798 [Xylariaceae sp. FL1651]|nr:hypothetical protein F5Y19DRAFT_464798 [Xylariaceae sp. FL1651]